MGNDEHTITALRDAAHTAVRHHHLESSVATSAWLAAHAPDGRRGRAVPIAAGVLGAAAVAAALAVWAGNRAPSPANGSACAANVTTDPLPTWARAGFSPAGLTTPHVVGRNGEIIAVLFVEPRVHQPSGTHNKILWVARTGFGPLTINARLENTSETVTRVLPNGPGPSYVDMPAAGCWQMNLTWAGQHDTLALMYGP